MIDVSARVIREHEPRHMGCACGAPMGDSIDYRWHLVNQTIAAWTCLCSVEADPPTISLQCPQHGVSVPL